MPDADGTFKGITVNAAAWERIFGKPKCSLHTFFNDDPVCAECGQVSKRIKRGDV